MGLGNVAAFAADDGDVFSLFIHGASKGGELMAKQAPLLGMGMTAIMTAEEMAVDAQRKQWRKMFNEAAAGVAEIAGSVLGFGVGDAAREIVRGAQVEIWGEKDAAEKSGLRKIAERAFEMIKPVIDKIGSGPGDGGPAGFGGGLVPAFA